MQSFPLPLIAFGPAPGTPKCLNCLIVRGAGPRSGTVATERGQWDLGQATGDLGREFRESEKRNERLANAIEQGRTCVESE